LQGASAKKRLLISKDGIAQTQTIKLFSAQPSRCRSLTPVSCTISMEAYDSLLRPDVVGEPSSAAERTYPETIRRLVELGLAKSKQSEELN
jgi:hypothetical protein